MATLIISTMLGITGYFIGGALGGEFFAVVLGIMGFFGVPFHILEQIYKRVNKEDS